ncbi:MAG: hypothetical protein QOI34_1017 [Verrucomicrobiota bacterium]
MRKLRDLIIPSFYCQRSRAETIRLHDLNAAGPGPLRV